MLTGRMTCSNFRTGYVGQQAMSVRVLQQNYDMFTMKKLGCMNVILNSKNISVTK